MATSFTPAVGSDNEACPPKSISFQDYLDLSALVFEWADSYDAKDWARLRCIIAPTLYVDYTKIGKGIWDAISADDFMAIVFAVVITITATLDSQ